MAGVRTFQLLSLGTACLMLCVLDSSRAEDTTLVPGSSGCKVIDSVLTKITTSNVFSDDNGFLRRIAYAETLAGQQPTATRNGAWAVSTSMLKATQVNMEGNAAHYGYLQPLRDAIANSTSLRLANGVAIQWRDVTFEQVRIPLVSALASRLYLHLLVSQLANKNIELRLDKQAEFWSKNFMNSSTDSYTADEEMRRAELFINRTRQLDDQCACSANVDMTFVIDMSGSVGETNYNRAKAFAAEIAISFRLGQSATRVALITYSTSPVLNFGFNASQNSSGIAMAINSAPYVGKGTSTASALYLMIRGVYGLNNTKPTMAPTTRPTTQTSPAPAMTTRRSGGAIPDGLGGGGGSDLDIPLDPTTTPPPTVPPTIAPQEIRTRVGIVITDGKSNDNVVPASNLAHDLGITLFAVGVGNTDPSELRAIASDPDGAHLYYVGDYTVIENIRTSVRQRSCLASAPIEFDVPVVGTLDGNETQYVSVPVDPFEPTVTITLASTEGDLDVFGSFQFPNPNSALNEFTAQVKEGETQYHVLTPADNPSGRRRRDATATMSSADTLYLSVVGRSTTNRFVLRAQEGNVAPTTMAPTLSSGHSVSLSLATLLLALAMAFLTRKM